MPKEEFCFIEKLYQAIEEQRSSIVDWDPSGKGFIVGNLSEFTNQILLRKFGIGRLDSFARKLNRHGFKRSKIDKNKIRFFHKYFNRQSKNLSKIKKLSKYESLPKHIKLRMIRQQLSTKNGGQRARQADIVNQIFETVKIGQAQQQDKQNGNISQRKGPTNEDQNGSEGEDIKIEPINSHYLTVLRTPKGQSISICEDGEENKEIGGVKNLYQYFNDSQFAEGAST